MINLIVATDLNGAIGIKGDNRLPWHHAKDMEYFKERTTGNIVIMGENTWFSLPDKYRPLPERKNIIISDCPYKVWESVTKDNNYPLNVTVSISIDNAVSYAEKENKATFVIGGYSIYKQFLEKDLIDQIYINVLKLELDNPKEDLLFFPFFPDDSDPNWVRQMKMETPEMTAYVYQSQNFIEGRLHV